MECVEIIVKIKLYDIIDVLQQKGHELNNLINGIYLMSAAMILLKTSKLMKYLLTFKNKQK